MKLYYSPGACSLSPHILLHEAEMPFEAHLASTKTHKLADGSDYYQINPKGYVPTLEFDDGQRLTEGPAIVQWIADQVPHKRLAPPAGTLERYRLMEWLNYITAELHKGFGVLFNPAMPEEAKALMRLKLADRFRFVDQALASRPYLLGQDFGAADAYLYVVTRWAAPMQVDLAGFEHMARFMERVAARPAVQRALQAEGLSPAQAKA
ncbi:glutathione transferase GstA [Ideonella sp. BN130291]|uniref:glutathione transferase GstA n=1 Tax=Ideonella sp. BN130291 TaxID=3112940 RepID=UPI002E26997F|nr:glutathione transferase GstA [Ideonella sp. BN130291]